MFGIPRWCRVSSCGQPRRAPGAGQREVLQVCGAGLQLGWGSVTWLNVGGRWAGVQLLWSVRTGGCGPRVEQG